MTDIRRVTPEFAVAPQLVPEDMPAAAAQGFRTVINNRPDGEAPGQPTGAEMKAAAEAAGLTYVALPIRGGPTAEQARAQAEAADGSPTLAYCRSGTRSITAWAIGQAGTGRRPPEELVSLGADAGYDLSAALG